MAKKIFKEEQDIKKSLLVFGLGAIILGLVGRFAWHLYYQSEIFGVTEAAYVFFIAVFGLLLFILYRLNMRTAISKKSISVEMSPWYLNKKKIYWRDVESCRIVKTPELAQWNGDNISYGYGQRYTLSGRNGVELKTKAGRTYFIGSIRLNDLEHAVKSIFQAS